ncbi:MAG: hypothetical protein ABIH84_03385 [bacterium]
MKKGSREWFDAIVNHLGDKLVGIEITHFPKAIVNPNCQVIFVLRDWPIGEIVENESLHTMEGFRMLSSSIRGTSRGDGSDMRTTVLFDFREDERCPKRVMLREAKRLGFTVAPGYLNTNTRTARFSPTVY